MNNFFPYTWFVILLTIGLIVIAIMTYHYVREITRRKKLEETAQGLGFSFSKTCSSPTEMGCGHLNLFQKGRRQRSQNGLIGQLEDVRVALFDYRYTTGHGKQQRTHRQTVATFQVPTPVFPDFQLRREHFFHKIGQLFGYQDISFEEYPGFSKRYLLRGSDEQAIRAFFTPSAIEFFEQLDQKWIIEGHGQWLIVYQPSKRVKPAKLSEFLEATWQLFLAFPTV